MCLKGTFDVLNVWIRFHNIKVKVILKIACGKVFDTSRSHNEMNFGKTNWHW